MKQKKQSGGHEKSSKTAAWTCFCRAVSFCENREELKSNDYIAPKMLPLILNIKVLRTFIIKQFTPKGLYEYVVARTKYLDEIFQKAMEEDSKQILIMGAGFDSRGIRFLKDESDFTVFEMDMPITQKSKLKQFSKRKITIPDQIKYISIDFNKESLEEKLIEYDFKFNEKTLFIFEGVLMYLDSQGISETFSVLQKTSGSGSSIVFDYVHSSVIDQQNTCYGEEAAYKRVKGVGEQWTFGIPRGTAGEFLQEYNFKMTEDLDSKALEQRYFSNTDVKINETHSIVLAEIL